MNKKPHCRYQRQKCGRTFAMPECGLVRCPHRAHNYITWLNVVEAINWLVDAGLLPEYRRITVVPQSK